MTTFTRDLLPGMTIRDNEGNAYRVMSIASEDNYTYTITVTDRHSAYGAAQPIKSNYLTKWETR